jgi:hypothetical protein
LEWELELPLVLVWGLAFELQSAWLSVLLWQWLLP